MSTRSPSSSGTAALHLGVRAEGWSAGDEVITSSLTFVASANCLLYEGVKPVFCDIDPVTLTLDTEAVAAAVGERTAGTPPVHIFGYPADLPALRRSPPSSDLGMLEDACQALGAHDSTGKKIGTERQPRHLRLLRQQADDDGGGRNPRHPGRAEVAEHAEQRAQPGPRAGHGQVEHDRLGFNYRLTDLHAAIGIAQLERLDEMLERARRTSRPLYRERLTQLGAAPAGDQATTDRPALREPRRRAAQLVRLLRAAPRGADRDAVIAALAQERDRLQGLPALHPPAAALSRALRLRGGEFPVAERVAERSLALPFFTAMTESQVDRVCTALAERSESDLDSPRCPASAKNRTRSSGGSTPRSPSTGGWRPSTSSNRKAHARALARLGVLDAASWRRSTEGLEQVSGELEGELRVRDDDEDIHMAIERRLTELIGPLGGKLHTARSRNDQVATDLALLVRAHAARAIALLRA